MSCSILWRVINLGHKAAESTGLFIVSLFRASGRNGNGAECVVRIIAAFPFNSLTFGADMIEQTANAIGIANERLPILKGMSVTALLGYLNGREHGAVGQSDNESAFCIKLDAFDGGSVLAVLTLFSGCSVLAVLTLDLTKLSPNVTSITDMALAAEAAGADSVSLINTLMGMAIDAERRKPLLSMVTGGLSGPCVKPVALRCVWQVAKAVKIPVVGLGGIMNATDAIEFFLAGATAIEIGTANFIDPETTVKVVDGINEYLDRHNFKSITEIIGQLEV